jgi:hypothetical protein
MIELRGTARISLLDDVTGDPSWTAKSPGEVKGLLYNPTNRMADRTPCPFGPQRINDNIAL